MSNYESTQSLNCLLKTLLIAALLLPGMAFGTTTSPLERPKTLRPALNSHLHEIQLQLENNDHEAALIELRQLESKYSEPPLNNMELAQINNLMGFGYFLTGDYESAISSYQLVARLDHKSPPLQSATLKTIAQLYFKQGQYKQALGYIEQAIVSEESAGLMPQENSLVLHKTANLELGNTTEAVKTLTQLNQLYPNEKYSQELARMHHKAKP